MIFKNEIVHDINNKNYGEKEKKSLLLLYTGSAKE